MSLLAPGDALRALLQRIESVDDETVPLRKARGRVLAAPLLTDRPSPPCDVSAMDGFCIRTADLRARMRITGEVRIGTEASLLTPGCAMRIVTGAHVPPNADAILRVEHVREEDGFLIVDESLQRRMEPGADIRRRGENAPAQALALHAGTLMGAPQMGVLATLGPPEVAVHRMLRVALLTTGDELVEPGTDASPWQIRDSNGPQLEALLDKPWLQLRVLARVGDNEAATLTAIRAALLEHDALIVTGGVSMGHRDHVPQALAQAGVELVFHRLAQRPGKPLLGGVASGGKPVLALPGNPVSVLACARRFALDALALRAGFVFTEAAFPPSVELLRTPTSDHASVHWYRLAKRTTEGLVLLEARGSGDLITLGQSDGFVEIPPNTTGFGPFPFYAWST